MDLENKLAIAAFFTRYLADLYDTEGVSEPLSDSDIKELKSLEIDTTPNNLVEYPRAYHEVFNIFRDLVSSSEKIEKRQHINTMANRIAASLNGQIADFKQTEESQKVVQAIKNLEERLKLLTLSQLYSMEAPTMSNEPTNSAGTDAGGAIVLEVSDEEIDVNTVLAEKEARVAVDRVVSNTPVVDLERPPIEESEIYEPTSVSEVSGPEITPDHVDNTQDSHQAWKLKSDYQQPGNQPLPLTNDVVQILNTAEKSRKANTDKVTGNIFFYKSVYDLPVHAYMEKQAANAYASYLSGSHTDREENVLKDCLNTYVSECETGAQRLSPFNNPYIGIRKQAKDNSFEKQLEAIAALEGKQADQKQEVLAEPQPALKPTKKRAAIGDFLHHYDLIGNEAKFRGPTGENLLNSITNFVEKPKSAEVTLGRLFKKVTVEDTNQDLRVFGKPQGNNFDFIANMAKLKGWDSVRLHGLDNDAKQQAWLRMSLVGIKVDGYEPNDMDYKSLKEAQIRMQSKPNSPQVKPRKEPVISITPA